jgi:hypothetical protein
MSARLLKPAFLLVLLAPLYGASLQGQDPNRFVGTWTMDASRSESPHLDVPVESFTMLITASDGGLSIETTRQDQGSPLFHEILHVKLDGSETTSTGNAGVPVRAHARWEGGALVVETSREVERATVTTHEKHSLSANGRDMTVEKTLTVQHGYQGSNPAMAPTTGHGKDVFVRSAS